MKGHAKIELTNVKTGEVQVIEEDNIVTNLLTDLAQHRVLHLQDSFATSRDRTLSNYDSENKNRPRTPFTEYGGLLMFKEQLEASEANYYPNEPVTMVAHASDNAYTGVDLTRGSFNTNLSSYNINEGRVTLVWDFNMEQGNGTIGTVCLCNHVDGQIGYGSMYSSENTNLGKAPFYHHGSNYSSGGPAMYVSLSKSYPADISNAPNALASNHTTLGYVPVWLDTASNKLVLMNQSYVAGSNLEFAVVDIDCNSVNPITITYNSDTSTNGYYYFTNTRRRIEYVDIPLHLTDIANSSTSFDSKYWGSGFCYIQMWSGLDFQGNFWFSSANRFYGTSSTTTNVSSKILTWTAGAVMRFTKLNLATMMTEEYEVTNTTGANITMNCGFSHDDAGWLTSLCEFHGYLLIRGDNAHLYAINLSNNSDVHEVVYADGTPVTVYKSSYECNGTAYGNGSSCYHRGWAVNRIGGFLIINTNGGAFDTTTDGNLIIIDRDFVARKLSSPSIAQFLSMSTSGNSQQNYNSSDYPVWCNSDTPLCLCVYYNYNSSATESYAPSFTWTDTNKRMTSYVYIRRFTYKPLGLITINTLAEPVTKTADMTMRITYTLTA